LLSREELGHWAGRDDVEFHISADRATGRWEGNVGVSTTLFPEIAVDPRHTVALTGGPPVRYRFVLMELLGKGIPPDPAARAFPLLWYDGEVR
jgi:NAD(P)H-flavin reductase